ncbi:hypothetical protein [Streptomyces sp. CBMA123]|uniref:hypothetical protein n=1 Tax=Streptomyces sp. CBMA123 TaxID=1896313 RepID=UPI00166209B7|nr:hypothetical protein [Streptomyces sp. CBMA123]
MTAVMVVMGALESGIATWGGYLGADVSQALGQMEDKRMAFLQHSLTMAYPADQ